MAGEVTTDETPEDETGDDPEATVSGDGAILPGIQETPAQTGHTPSDSAATGACLGESPAGTAQAAFAAAVQPETPETAPVGTGPAGAGLEPGRAAIEGQARELSPGLAKKHGNHGASDNPEGKPETSAPDQSTALEKADALPARVSEAFAKTLDASAASTPTPAHAASKIESGQPGQAPQQAHPAQTPVLHQVPLGSVPVEIGLKSLAGVNRFEIRLDPAELGRIDVRLDIGDSGEVKAHLVVDRVETLALLQRDAKTLERAFEQAGLKPSDGGIDLSLRDPSGDRRGGEQPRDERGQRPAARPDQIADSDARDAAQAPRRVLWRGTGGVDLRI
jgi:flagellar hook-length control protein FliK